MNMMQRWKCSDRLDLSSSSSRERVVEGGRKTPRQSSNVQVLFNFNDNLRSGVSENVAGRGDDGIY